MRITIYTVLLMLALSCSRRQPRVAAPAPTPPPVAAPSIVTERISVPPPATAPLPAGVSPPVSTRMPEPPPAVIALEDAIRQFARGEYPGAARDFLLYLNLVPSGGQRDQALFHLGLIYSQPGDPRIDWQRAASYFNQVVNEFPFSPLKPAAQLILTLKSETVQLASESETRNLRIRQLNTELERLIRIDSERRPK